MGVWGTGAFDNDEAIDWLYLLDEEGDTLLWKTLEEVTRCQEYLEASVCFKGIAAAEIVAALKDEDISTLPNVAGRWVSKRSEPPKDSLVKLALEALRRIRTNSEIRDLWSESGSIREWLGTLMILEERLELRK